MAKIHEGDREIDATFSVEAFGDQTFVIFFESRSGTIGKPSARNTQYEPGLDALLKRLGEMGAVIGSIALAPSGSEEVTELSIPGRRFPLEMRNVVSPHDLRMEIGSVQAATNRMPNAKGLGNHTKRIRIAFRVQEFRDTEAPRLENALAGTGFNVQSPEVQEAAEVVSELAGRTTRDQGFQQSPAVRIAVEQRAMDLAIQHYQSKGWNVDPSVARSNCFDLLCRRGGDVLHVEVKGTQGDGREVLLTPNEVDHARREFPWAALVVVSNIAVTDQGRPLATGGDLMVFEPWKIDDGQLRPIGFTYVVPRR
jgi:hypothetical protein